MVWLDALLSHFICAHGHFSTEYGASAYSLILSLTFQKTHGSVSFAVYLVFMFLAPNNTALFSTLQSPEFLEDFQN
jgi:hypothetical protein